MADRLFLFPIGGVKNPEGTLDITSEGVYDVTDYAEVDVDIFNDTGTKDITDNGTYNAGDDGYIGYSQVTVDVPASAVVSGTKSITTNGTEDVTDYAEVSVNVPASEVVSGTKSITANGIEDVTDYASVDVNVPASEVDSGTLETSITQNGETEYDVTGYAGHTVTVNVPASEVDSGTKNTSISQNGSTDVNVVGYATNRITVSVPNGTETKTVTDNGTYTPTAPNIGFSEVTVSVPASAVVSGTKSISTNGVEDVTNYASVDVDVQPNLQDKTVNPSTSQVTVTCDNNYDGLDTVTVNAVTSSIDANITAGNIKDGVTILGVTGSYDPQPTLDTLNVTPSTTSQTITPTGGVDGYDEVNVDAVTSSIDANISAGNIKSGVTILGVTGNYAGATCNLDTVNVTPSTSSQNITPTGGLDGFSSVTVDAVTSSIDNNITAGNIKSGVSILGVTGDYDPQPNLYQPSAVTPSTSQQTVSIPQGYDGLDDVTVNAVTSSIDANITAGNIKDGVTILGVTGSYDPQPTLDSITITPTTSSQSITPTGGVDGYDDITVNAVTSSIDANITAGNIKDGVTILGVTGSYDPQPALETLNVTPSTQAQTITPSGIDGYDEVNVSAVTSSIDANITAGNIKSGVSILGVTGDYDPQPSLDSLTITPSTSSQSITPPSGTDGYNDITVNAVTSSIDNNITAGNIKDGVTILGVTGTYQGGEQPDVEPLCFTAEEAGVSFYLNMVNLDFTPVFEKSFDKINWTSWDGATSITLPNIGDKIYLRGNNSTLGLSSSAYSNFIFNNESAVSASGELTSLLNKKGVEYIPNYCFKFIFRSCRYLTTAPEITATSVGDYAFRAAFDGCSSLITSPSILPFKTIGHYALYNMFINCTSLTTAPRLDFESVGKSGCQYMFDNCTSLTTAPTALYPKIASRNCYRSMFEGCTSLTTAPVIYATEIEEYSLKSMFKNCTSLTTAPQLSATTIANYCYKEMFYGCSSLTTAPSSLPATTAKIQCYYGMFQNCTSLTTAPEIHLSNISNDSTRGSCMAYMFNGCTLLNYIKVYTTNWDTRSGTSVNAAYWVQGVASTGNFYKPSSLTISSNYHETPPGWTVQNF